MNVKGPGQPPTPAVSGGEDPRKLDQPNHVEKASGSPGRAEPGKFAEKVSGARPAETASVAAGSRLNDVMVGDLAADLQSGKITSRDAVDKILERVVARQLGPEAPVTAQERVRAALQDAIDSDPLLADKLRQLD